MEERFPDLVKECLRVMPVQKIAEILQRLVSEEVSIRNLRAVLEALVEWGQKEKDTVLLTEYVRIALKRYISHKYTSGHNILPAYLLAPRSRKPCAPPSGRPPPAVISPSIRTRHADWSSTSVNVSAIWPPARNRPVLLTSMDIRRYTRKMIEADLYALPVLSYQELTPEINVQPLGRVDL